MNSRLRPRTSETSAHVSTTPAKRRLRSHSSGRNDAENAQKSPASAKKRQSPSNPTTPSKRTRNAMRKVFDDENEEEKIIEKKILPRKSTIAQHVSKTPSKTQPEKAAKKKVELRRTRTRSPRGGRAPFSSKIHLPSDPSSSSSSSSDDDSEDDFLPTRGHPADSNLEMSEDEHEVSDIFDDLSDKENLRTPASRSKREVSKDLSNMTLNDRTPAKNTRSAYREMNKVFKSLSDDDSESDQELFNESIKKEQKRSAKRILTSINIPKSAKKGITPIRLTVTKTPGGTRKYATRSRKQESDDDEEIEARPPIPKLRLKLLPTSSIADRMRDLADRLHLSEVPQTLPCREKEAGELRKFIEQATHAKRGESSAMYISGVPGTGKTATVRAVIESMKSSKKFVYAEVNAMIFRKKVFVEIFNQIQENYSITAASTPRKSTVVAKIAPATARQRLNTIFRKADQNRPPIIILVDELDGLCNRKQDVLYDIFDWTSKPEARVTIIAIANTLDFPERMLCQRISSRLDKRRLIFQPYEHRQIEQIIDARVNGSDVIDMHAVQLVARKVSAISGDLRQSLDMLRRSIRIAIEQNAPKVTMIHVNMAQKAVAEPLKMRLIKSLKLHKFMLFRSVLTVNQTTDKEETIFEEVYKMYCVLCSALSGISPVAISVAYELLLQLCRCSLVVLSSGQCGMLRRRVKLGMATYEAEKCVKQVEELRKNL